MPCVSSSPVDRASSAPPSFPNCSEPATRWWAWPVRTLPPPPWPSWRRRCCAVTSRTSTACAAGLPPSDGVVHLGYVHDFSDMAIGAAVDLRAIGAIGTTLAGSEQAVRHHDGDAVARARGRRPRAGRLRDRGRRVPLALPRVASENAAIALAEQGVRSAAIRLSPSVHGVGDHGFVPHPDRHRARERRVGLRGRRRQPVARGAPPRRGPAVPARRRGGTGRLALARRRRRGGAVPRHRRGHRPPSRRARGRSIPPTRRPRTSGSWAPWCRLDNPTSNALTRERLGWEPVEPGLMADLDEGHYFA